MKKAILSTMGLVALMSLNAQTPVPPPPPVVVPGQTQPVAPAQTQNPEFIQFKETVHDFGNIRQGTPVTHTFEFKNVGKKDITLVNVSVSCGCTTPNWKGGVYKPGETAIITATYNAASEGHFNKTVTVTTSEGVHILTLTGNVMGQTAYDEWKSKAEAEAAAQKAKEESTKKSETRKKSSKKSSEKAPADKTKATKETPKKSS